MRRMDLSGSRFGNLTVLEKTERRGRDIAWLVRCDCGAEKFVAGSALRSGLTVTCGSCRFRRGKLVTDLNGLRFGRLLVLDEHQRRNKRTYWKVRCDCGTPDKFVSAGALQRGATRSCGCKQGEGGKNWTTHGLSKDPVYSNWKGMRERCLNVKGKSYPDYGGRGIRIASAWMDFPGFHRDMASGYLPGLTLERLDVNGDYCFENCIWIDRGQQSRNRRTTVTIDTPAGKMLLSDASRKYGVNHGTLHGRWRSGSRGTALVRPVKRAVDLPPKTLVRISTARLITELQSRGYQVSLGE